MPLSPQSPSKRILTTHGDHQKDDDMSEDKRQGRETENLTDPENLVPDISFIDDTKLLAAARQRRRELQVRCLHELWERFGIEVTSNSDHSGAGTPRP
jgi:hypothetical protein